MIVLCKKIIPLLLLVALSGCAAPLDIYRDANMDFGAIRTVAVMPLVGSLSPPGKVWSKLA